MEFKIKTIKDEFLRLGTSEDCQTVASKIGDDKLIAMIQVIADKGELKGIYSDISNEVYHRCTGLSKSALIMFDEDPVKFHYRYILGNKEEKKKDAFEFGTLYHEILLEPDKFYNTYVSDKFAYILGKRNSNKYKDEINRFILEFPEKKIVNCDDYEDIIKIKDAVYSNPFAETLLKAPGLVEHTIFWVDPIRKILLKCRPDKLIPNFIFDDYKTRNFIIDLKSTLEVFKFEKSISKWKYYIQHPWYSDGTKYALGIKDLQLLFIATDKEVPFYTRVGQLDIPSEGLGCLVARDMLDRFSLALQNGFIPEQRVETFSLPDYEYLKQENKKEIRNYE